MITSKTGTSPIAWASSPWEQLYKALQRKRPTLPLKNKFNQSLPDSTTDSNSSNSRLQSLSLNHSTFIQSFFAFILPNLIFILRFFSAISPQFNSDILFFLQYLVLYFCQSLHSRFQCNDVSFTCPNFIKFNKLLSVKFFCFTLANKIG